MKYLSLFLRLLSPVFSLVITENIREQIVKTPLGKSFLILADLHQNNLTPLWDAFDELSMTISQHRKAENLLFE